MTNYQLLMTNPGRGQAAGRGQALPLFRLQPASAMVRMPISLLKGGD